MSPKKPSQGVTVNTKAPSDKTDLQSMLGSGGLSNAFQIPNGEVTANIRQLNLLRSIKPAEKDFEVDIDFTQPESISLDQVDPHSLHNARFCQVVDEFRKNPFTAVDFAFGTPVVCEPIFAFGEDKVTEMTYQASIIEIYEQFRATKSSKLNEVITRNEALATILLLRETVVAALVHKYSEDETALYTNVAKVLEIDREIELRFLQVPQIAEFTKYLLANTLLSMLEHGVSPNVVKQIEKTRKQLGSESQGKKMIFTELGDEATQKMDPELSYHALYIFSRLIGYDLPPEPMAAKIIYLNMKRPPKSSTKIIELVKASDPYDYDFLQTINPQKTPHQYLDALEHCQFINPEDFAKHFQSTEFSKLLELSRSAVPMLRDRALLIIMDNFEHITKAQLTSIITEHYWDADLNKPADPKMQYPGLIKRLYDSIKSPHFAPKHKERLLSVIREIAVKFITESAGGADQDVRGLRLPAVESLLENLSQGDLSKLALVRLDPPIMFDTYDGIMECSQLGVLIASSLMIIPNPKDPRHKFRREPSLYGNLYKMLKNYDLVKAQNEFTEFTPYETTFH